MNKKFRTIFPLNDPIEYDDFELIHMFEQEKQYDETLPEFCKRKSIIDIVLTKDMVSQRNITGDIKNSSDEIINNKFEELSKLLHNETWEELSYLCQNTSDKKRLITNLHLEVIKFNKRLKKRFT